MKRKYRISLDATLNSRGNEVIDLYLVQLHRWYGWVTIKAFSDDDDNDYAFRCAMELLDTLNE
jgi:hypothetical protein